MVGKKRTIGRAFFKDRDGSVFQGGFKITSIRGSKIIIRPTGISNRIFPINSRKTRRGKKLRGKKLVPTKNIIQIIYPTTEHISFFNPPARFCSLFITISMNRCTVTDAAQIKCKQHFRPHPPLFITFHAPPDIYLYYHLHTHLPTCFLVLPLHQRKYIYIDICVYVCIPDYILFIISDHEENGKSMRNSDYMRVYFPSSVGTRTYTHPSYSFSLL